VVAGLVRRAEDWPWSSVRAHLAGEDDELATVAPLRALIPDFAAILTAPADPAATARIERAPIIGRSLGAPEWVASGGSAAASHPANPASSREHEGTAAENCRCRDRSSKLLP
jgi:putative transposase